MVVNKQFWLVRVVVVLLAGIVIGKLIIMGCDDWMSKILTFKNSSNLIEENPASNLTIAEKEPSVEDRVKQITKCMDKQMLPSIRQRGEYWVLYNYIRAEQKHKCHESITYTTHGDYSFLDNLEPVVERWQGPISMALYAPGRDFQDTLDSIIYLRECASPLIRRFISFHLYFKTGHVPDNVPRYDQIPMQEINCSVSAPFMNATFGDMYRSEKNLLYPINVGRNIARESAQTYYVFPSDIELYPSHNVIPQFLAMIAENDVVLQGTNPKVFSFAVFEVPANQSVPDSKTELKKLLVNKIAIPFRINVCSSCHSIPKSEEWQAANETDGLHVFHIEKRLGPFGHWEPFYIGTNLEPLYDELLTWEGMSDKMTQGYALCLLNYDFMMLDNVFLVHKPGVQVETTDSRHQPYIAETQKLIADTILPELGALYGHKEGCRL